LRDDREWYWKIAAAIAARLDAFVARSPALTRRLKTWLTPRSPA
jgi:hypothetical protein